MADKLEGLQVRGWVEITQGGYAGEEKGVSSGLTGSFTDAEDVGETTATYYYRDSNLLEGQLPNLNNSSSQVDVKMKTKWSAKKGSNNHIIVDTETFILSISRCCKRNNPPISYNPTRTINVSGTRGNVLRDLVSSPASEGVIWSGNKSLGKNTYDIAPGKEVSPNELSATYLNYTTGFWSPGNPLPSQFVDEMKMGVQFKNNLPDECAPPALLQVEQTDDICENEVEACLIFAPCSCEGMGLHLEYRFDTESWEDAVGSGQVVEQNALNNANNVVCLQHLPPTNHTGSPVVFYWRVKYYPITSDMPETTVVNGNFEMIFILHPHETVPDITPQECAKLQRGDLIGKYEEETCYNEFSCADLPMINRERVK